MKLNKEFTKLEKSAVKLTVTVEKSDVQETYKTILDKYHLLNEEGRQRLLERADELIELGYIAKGDALKEA